jgi:DNA-directed RNA polymerase specialized sigma24 family protein
MGGQQQTTGLGKVMMAHQALSKRGRSAREILFKEIMQSLKLLPGMLRRIFVRSHYQGKNELEISQELGIPKETVRSMLRDANRIFYRNLHHFNLEN